MSAYSRLLGVSSTSKALIINISIGIFLGTFTIEVTFTKITYIFRIIINFIKETRETFCFVLKNDGMGKLVPKKKLLS